MAAAILLVACGQSPTEGEQSTTSALPQTGSSFGTDGLESASAMTTTASTSSSVADETGPPTMGSDTGPAPACADARSISASRTAQPLITWADLPFSIPFLGVSPFHRVNFIPGPSGGHFVASGSCSFQTQGAAHESGGLVLLDAEGGYLGQRDVCHDTAIAAPGCSKAAGCRAGHDVHFVGPDLIVRELDPGSDWVRSPVLYDLESGQVEMRSRVFFNDVGLFDAYGSSMAAAAVAADRMWAHRRFAAGGERELVEFGMTPEFTELATLPIPEFPVIGVGPLLVTTDDHLAMPKLSVFVRDTSTSGLPVVATLSANDRPFLFAVADPFDPTRVALVWRRRDGQESLVEIYGLVNGALSVEASHQFGTREIIAVAVMADYLLVSSCEQLECDLRLKRGQEEIEIDSLPIEREFGDMRRANGVAIAPTGAVVVGTGPAGEQNGELWRYTINDPDPTCRG